MKKLSTALQILTLAWSGQGYKMGHSWRRLNEAMQTALGLAIRSGMEFGIDDFAYIAAHWNPGYWWGDLEEYYACACGGGYSKNHGPNMSAILAIEKYLNRKPFIVCRRADGSARDRLWVGERFDWHENMEKRLCGLEVTSFKPAEGDRPAHVIACTHKPGDYPRKVDRIFRITHADIAAYHKAIRDFERSQKGAEVEAAIKREAGK